MESKKLDTEDNWINEKLTRDLEKQEKYVNFNNWLKKNGVIYNGLKYPVAFGEAGVLGVASDTDLPPLTAIISIPNKVIISYDKARFSELKSLFKQNKDLFSEKENDEAGLNILTVFMMFERLKGKRSQWHEYFEILNNPETILAWTDEEIKAIPDLYVQRQALEFKEQVEELWDELKEVLLAYSQFFQKSTVTKELFLWAYNAVMSRCFGFTETGTCIVPFADCLNHSKYHATYLYAHKDYENGTLKKHPNYILKSNTVDLSIIDKRLENKKTPNMFKNPVLDYVKTYREDHSFQPSTVRSQMIKSVHDINSELLVHNKDMNIWDLKFFTTTDDEDNDTESDEETDVSQKKEIAELKVKENSTLRTALEKVRRYEESLKNQGRMSQEEEAAKREKQFKADEAYQKKLREQQMEKLEAERKAGMGKEEREEEEENQLDLKNLYHLNEEEFDWYNCTDENIYFTFASNKPISRNEQVYNFYGRRTNRYLLSWYGFAYEKNEYDSYSFRLLLHKKSEEITETNVRTCVFTDYITYAQWEDGIEVNGKVFPANIFSKEFKLKRNQMCYELINYMRIHKMQYYNGVDRDAIMVTQPKSINFELRIIEACLLILGELKRRTSELAPPQRKSFTQDHRFHFAKILQSEHQHILDKQITFFSILKDLLEQFARNKLTLRELYLEKLYPFEKEEEFIENRYSIAQYLKSLSLIKQ